MAVFVLLGLRLRSAVWSFTAGAFGNECVYVTGDFVLCLTRPTPGRDDAA